MLRIVQTVSLVPTRTCSPFIGRRTSPGRFRLLLLAENISQLLRKVEIAYVLRWFSSRGHMGNSVALITAESRILRHNGITSGLLVTREQHVILRLNESVGDLAFVNDP